MSVTEHTQNEITPNGDTNHGFTKETTPGEHVREFYRKQGEKRATENLIEFLRSKRVIRDGFFGEPGKYVVVYTEDGAIDVSVEAFFEAGRS